MTIIFGLIALIALSVLVLVHELGHFIIAKRAGVWVEEFGIGLPPRLWGKKKGDTLYSINALPIGGFVRLHGENLEDKVTKKEVAFVKKSKIARIAISLGGIFMNFVFAFVAFTLVYWFSGIPRGAKIASVSPSSPAFEAGITQGDEIVSLAGVAIREKDTEVFPRVIFENKGEGVLVEIKREKDGKEDVFTKTVNIRSEAPPEEGLMGVEFSPSEVYFPPLLERPFVMASYGFQKTLDVTNQILYGLVMVARQLLGGQVPEGVAGPVGVTAIVAEVTKLGILPLLEFMGIISINLALINLVPFPPLDGSRVLFIAFEAILGRKMLPKVESTIHTVGMAILLILMITLTANEIPRLLSAGSLSKFVEGFIQ